MGKHWVDCGCRTDVHARGQHPEPTPPTDENVSPRTEAGRWFLALGGTRLYWRAVMHSKVVRARILAIEREASSPALDVERLAETINNVAKANPPHPALPISRTIPDAAAAYAAEYARLAHPDSDGDAR